MPIFADELEEDAVPTAEAFNSDMFQADFDEPQSNSADCGMRVERV